MQHNAASLYRVVRIKLLSVDSKSAWGLMTQSQAFVCPQCVWAMNISGLKPFLVAWKGIRGNNLRGYQRGLTECDLLRNKGSEMQPCPCSAAADACTDEPERKYEDRKHRNVPLSSARAASAVNLHPILKWAEPHWSCLTINFAYPALYPAAVQTITPLCSPTFLITFETVKITHLSLSMCANILHWEGSTCSSCQSSSLIRYWKKK